MYDTRPINNEYHKLDNILINIKYFYIILINTLKYCNIVLILTKYMEKH